MNFILGLLVLTPSASAQRIHTQVLVAQRYPDSSSRMLRRRIAQLAELRSASVPRVIDINPKRPLLGHKTSLLAELRKRVLATSPDEKLNMQVVIDGHGSTKVIGSRRCEPIGYDEFASAWRALTSEFREKGYRAENLSFDLILHFCFSGNLRDLLGPAQLFDTLIVTSAQKDHEASSEVLNDMYKRTVATFSAAKAARVNLHGADDGQLVLHFLLEHFFRRDIRTGRASNGSKLPAPDITWWPATSPRQNVNLKDLANGLFNAYAHALAHVDEPLAFTRMFRFFVTEYYAEELAQAISGLANGLYGEARLIHEHLFFHRQLDDDITTSHLTDHFTRMLATPNRNIRDAAAWDLMMLGDMVKDADVHFASLADYDLSEVNPSAGRLRLHLEVLREYKTPLAGATCARLLDALGQLPPAPANVHGTESTGSTSSFAFAEHPHR